MRIPSLLAIGASMIVALLPLISGCRLASTATASIDPANINSTSISSTTQSATSIISTSTNASSRISRRAVGQREESGARRAPVIVELFTSEGCSSCPPADKLIARLEQSQSIAGAEVIAMEEHVDYWNNSSWADPFSAPGFSARQNNYSRRFGLNEVYTPQMVIDGQAQFVGSDEDQATASIARATRQPKAEVHITGNLRSNTAQVPIQVAVDHLPGLSRGDKAEIILVVTEDGLHSNVAGGENAGRSLTHIGVVRDMRLLGAIDPGQASFTETAHLEIKPKWKRESLRVVAFVQERTSRRVLGAASVRLV